MHRAYSVNTHRRSRTPFGLPRRSEDDRVHEQELCQLREAAEVRVFRERDEMSLPDRLVHEERLLRELFADLGPHEASGDPSLRLYASPREPAISNVLPSEPMRKGHDAP